MTLALVHPTKKSAADLQFSKVVIFVSIFSPPRLSMSRSAPSLPTSLRLNPNAPLPTQKQIHLSTKLFTPAPILRFTVGKYSQLPAAESPEVAVLGRSNVGVSSLWAPRIEADCRNRHC